jgi:DNA-binding transcriptional regulator GbsR (MarR family)
VDLSGVTCRTFADQTSRHTEDEYIGPSEIFEDSDKVSVVNDLATAAEELALVFARSGMQRTMARVFAAFLFTDEPSLTLGDLVDSLRISTGSASTGIRALVDVGLLEQVPVPGSRRDHYRMRDDAWATLFSNQNAAVRTMREAAEKGIARSKKGSPAHQRLERMRGFYDFLLAELPTLVARWHQQQTRTNRKRRS